MLDLFDTYWACTFLFYYIKMHFLLFISSPTTNCFFMLSVDIAVTASVPRRDVLSVDKAFDGNIGSFYSSNEFDRDTNPLILGQFADEVVFAGGSFYIETRWLLRRKVLPSLAVC